MPHVHRSILSPHCSYLNTEPITLQLKCWRFLKILQCVSNHHTVKSLILKKTCEEPYEMHLRIIYLDKERIKHLSLISGDLTQQ